MRDLLIIARTCGRVFGIHGDRYVKKSKPEIINTCLSSLVNSMNQVSGHKLRLIVLDDGSNERCVADIKTILSKCKWPAEFETCAQSGNGGSMDEVYKKVDQLANDLWYHVEDDYLHKPEAIQDMLDTVTSFEGMLGLHIALNPHDDVWRYTREVYPSHILFGPKRHYRTVKHTTYTCLASKKLYTQYKDIFQRLVDLTKQQAHNVENASINHIWNQQDVMLFSPIPGLAFHLMDETGRDPYLDFDSLWHSVPKLWVNHE